MEVKKREYFICILTTNACYVKERAYIYTKKTHLDIHTHIHTRIKQKQHKKKALTKLAIRLASR